MKQLKKHPKQQRMEDMQIPGMPKTVPVFNDLPEEDQKKLIKGAMKISKKLQDDKVTYEGREWLRSISDPHHGRHMLVKILFVLAIIYCVIVIL